MDTDTRKIKFVFFNDVHIDISKIVDISDAKFYTPACVGDDDGRVYVDITFENSSVHVRYERRLTKWFMGFPHFINKDDDPDKNTEIVWDCNNQRTSFRLNDRTLTTDRSKCNDFLCVSNLQKEVNNIMIQIINSI